MLLQYGCVNLNLLHMQEFSREAVYEHTTYVYTKYRLVMRAVYNPATQQDSWNFTPAYGQPQNNNTGLPYVPAVSNPRAGRAMNPGAGLAPVGAPQFSLPANYRGNPQGVPAVVSDAALRHALMQPRQQLIFSVGGIVSVQSPLVGFQTDVMNGPTPLFCNVQQIQGTRTWVVDYGIETAINECPVYAGKVPAILSHVWNMRQDMDADYFTTRIIQGRVLFRADSMARMGVNPDNYRGMLALGVPFGTKREKISVNVGNPPNLLEYELVDRQLPLGWNQTNPFTGLPLPGLPTRLKASHTIGVQQAGAETALTNATKGALRDIAENLSRFKGGLLDFFGAEQALGESAALAVRLGAGGLEFLQNTLPTNYHHLVVEAWGGADSSRSGLEVFARSIINQRLAAFSNFFAGQVEQVIAAVAGANGIVNTIVPGAGNVLALLSQPLSQAIFNGFNLLHSIDSKVTHDVMGKYVRVEHMAQSGPILALLENSPLPGTFLSSAAIFPGPDDTGSIIYVNGQAPGPPGDYTSRGSWTGQCVAAALQASCDIPLIPNLNPVQGMVENLAPPYLQSRANPYTE